ncbi:hypothetical protein K504DRAFT_484812 [Pleomassaria siparia CBS 279.74]|uniref:C2H2-type domain-containing protein n=1 Tax=Pleomassaria siparia CBS 279.74 TaxID=1314801 RepID=A0A6G1JXZ0_9PLEO|nr:hypothetical protein K504DRAFT_484812 [Pleomassaria siparia CBS 279.74]
MDSTVLATATVTISTTAATTAATAAPTINTMPKGRKRKDVANGKNDGRRFQCENQGCGRTFTRAEHLQRHLLNHSTGEYTCTRCRAHFKRRDLLDRHMARHRQKDDEAGAAGHGVLNTRKRMWKDADGNIVTKKPTLNKDVGERSQSPYDHHHHHNPLQQLSDFVPFQHHHQQQQHHEGAPISPPTSHDPSSLGQSIGSSDHDNTVYPPDTLDASNLSNPAYSPDLDQRFWSAELPQPEPEPEPFIVGTAFDDAPLEDIFNPDTASSFNNPFTTMNNYNWLFDMDLSRQEQIPQSMPDSFPTFHFPPHNSVSQPSHAFDLQLDHMVVDKTLSTAGHYGSIPSQRADSLHQTSPPAPLVSPPLTDDELNGGKLEALLSPFNPTAAETTPNMMPASRMVQQASQSEVERPLSMLQPSRSLPIIDELARAQLLDLIDVTQPVAPDGSLVTRDHYLLSLSCLQTYCDLFFTRFNTTYPLIHMSTFDPSHVDTLFLASVLLLGATYGEKDAHQLAVCIHDVLRPQIFANAGFSSKPDLWVLQTILLVECFGKSRAGQKQHEMSHLFHGLLINLIRRSDCQSIRPPTLEDATDDLEDDWQTWVDAEQKKRLAFLCFMWDTQHAVLFCQSLCMSAFELRSPLPCDQSLWEAESAESWHQQRQKQQPQAPLFLSCLKMYLNPGMAQVPRNLNRLSRSLLLHGLMSIAWDMQRRDQTSLSVIDTNPLGNWQSRLAASYSAWHHDFSLFSTEYLSRLPANSPTLLREFQASRTATLTLYHAAHILLHTPFLDLQIYAGARHILGRPVARADYARSQKVVKKWVADNMKEASNAVWHAAELVDRGVDVIDGEGELGGGRLWHLPWAVYLGTLVVWGVWYARPVPPSLPPLSCTITNTSSSTAIIHQRHDNDNNSNNDNDNEDDEDENDDDDDDEDEIIWDPSAEMKAFLRIIINGPPEGLLNGGIRNGVGKRGTNSLAAVVSRCLSKVRWAVVHDGMMVLRGLVSWRLVGGGGMGMGMGMG